MPLIEGSSKKAIEENTQREIEAGKDPKQAYAIANSVARANDDDDTGTARQYDINGWYEIQDNPISRAGVFEYLGAKLGKPDGLPEGQALDPNAFYSVLRAPEELSDPECLSSFRLVPWIVGHTMLGDDPTKDLTPAEQKGIHGFTGEQIYFDPQSNEMRGNVKVVSGQLAGLIDSGENELSLGYRCRYVWEPGVWNGQPYQIRQIMIRGNHLASVDEGRMGPSVAVLDSRDRFVSTFDAKDFKMADENGKKPEDENKDKPAGDAGGEGGGEGGGAGGGDDNTKLKDVTAAFELVGQLMPLISKFQELAAGLGVGTAAAAGGEGTGQDEGSDTKPPTTVATTTTTTQDEDDKEAKEAKAMDAAERTIVQRMHRRDALASRLKPLIPALDHSAMTERQLAIHGAKTLGISIPTGADPVTTVDAYLQGRAARPKEVTARPGTAAMDAKDKAKGPGLFSKALAGGAKG